MTSAGGRNDEVIHLWCCCCCCLPVERTGGGRTTEGAKKMAGPSSKLGVLRLSSMRLCDVSWGLDAANESASSSTGISDLKASKLSRLKWACASANEAADRDVSNPSIIMMPVLRQPLAELGSDELSPTEALGDGLGSEPLSMILDPTQNWSIRSVPGVDRTSKRLFLMSTHIQIWSLSPNSFSLFLVHCYTWSQVARAFNLYANERRTRCRLAGAEEGKIAWLRWTSFRSDVG